MNNAYKNVYKIIIIVTVISLIVTGLSITGAIDVTSDTGSIITEIATMLLLMSFLFSRNAGVIANRKNVIGNIITLILLTVLLFFTVTLIFDDLSVPETITKIISHALILSTLIALIYEIPQANTTHGTFQKLLTVAVVLTYAFYIGFAMQAESIYEDIYDSKTYEGMQAKIKSIETFQNFLEIATLVTFTGYIINPMLRVYYIDKDYANIKEIDDILYESAKNNIYNQNTNPNPTKMIDPKYLNQNQQINPNQPQVPVQQPAPKPAAPAPVQEPIKELPKEKVVNPNFKQENLPEAIIPTITSVTESPTLESAPLEEVVQPVAQPEAPKVEATPLEEVAQPAVQPEAPKVEATPLEEIAQPVVQPEAPKVEATPLEEVAQPIAQPEAPKVESTPIEEVKQ